MLYGIETRSPPWLCVFAFQIGDEAAGRQQLGGARVQRSAREGAVLRQVVNLARHQIDFELVAGRRRNGRVRRHNGGQSHVDGVAEENACEGCANHGAGARELQCGGGLFAAGAAAEIPTRQDELARPQLCPNPRVDQLKQVLCRLFTIRDVEVAAGINDVRIDIVSQSGPDAAAELQTSIRHGSLSLTTDSGCASLPAMAEAATTAGLAR